MARPEPPTRVLRRLSQPRRGLSRDEAAVYIGVSRRKFEPKMIDARRVWDIRSLDLAFDALPTDG